MAVLTTGRLPVRLTPLVGRDAELGEVTRAIAGARMLTLTGPGGAGKTRLALAAAGALAGDNEVAWVELGPVDDPAIVGPAVAGRLGVPETPGLDAAGAIAAHVLAQFTDRPLLVVLDNCEHLAGAVAELAERLLADCPALSVLATSREPLGVEGERSWPVPPLDGADAVRLFADRARLVAPSFDVTDANRGEVAEVCAKLDRLPLAIELAAARMRILSVRQLAERLGDVFGVLTGGARSAPPRHQALRATLDWSHDLLAADERAAFRRLAVFSGGFTLAGAERVAGFGEIAAPQVLDLLARLADKSLLRVDRERYHLLATIREYARERLADSGEADDARLAHLAHYTDFAEEAGPRVDRAAAAELEGELDRLDLERSNLRAASDFARQSGDAISALRIAGQLGRYAYLRGHYQEIRQWMDLAVTAGASAPAGMRAKALLGSGRLAYLQCDYEPAVRRLDAALLLCRSLGDASGIASCLQALGSVAREQGRYARSAQLHSEARELARACADERAEAAARNYLGFVSWLQGDFALAASECTAALAMFRMLGDVEGTAWSLISLGAVARYQGDFAAAESLLGESLALSESIGFREGVAWSLEQLGLLEMARAAPGSGPAPASAAQMLRRSFETHRELRDRWRMSSLLEDLAALWLAGAAYTPSAALAASPGAASTASQAAAMLGAAQALREAIGTVIAPCERSQHDSATEKARAALSEEAFEQAWRRGAAASDPVAVLGDPEPVATRPFPIVTDPAPVTAVPGPGSPAANPEPGPAAPGAAPAADPPPAPAADPPSRRPVARVPVQPRPGDRAVGALRVRALGTASVELADVALTAADWGYAKPRELLFLLVTSPPLTREQVGAALWPDLARRQLGNALHTALRELRRALGDPEWVLYSGGRYGFNRAREHDCDVDTFEAALAAAGRARPAEAALPELQRAISAYGGDFLAGMSAGEWAQARRDELRRRFESALLAAGRLHIAAGRYQAAVTAFRRAIEHEPLNESAHRELMTCWEQLGETARAVRHYEELVALLRDQVGVPPAAETTELYRRLSGRS
jgi:predicted ATPase/DNA-binding SARP family transcriptional activator